MKSIKHLIITRFLCDESMSMGKHILDENILQNGKHLLKTYLLPSLNNQTCKDFEFVILTHPHAKINFDDLICDFKFIVIPAYQLKELIKDYSNKYDILITTIIDYDDMIYYNAVKDTQDHIDDSPIKLYAYLNGSKYYINTNNCYKYKPGYYGIAPVGIFISLISNTKYNKEKTVFMAGHNNLPIALKKLYKEMNLEYNDKYFEFNTTIDNAWLYVRHGMNDSKFVGRTKEEEGEIETNKIKYSNEYMHKMFGYNQENN